MRCFNYAWLIVFLMLSGCINKTSPVFSLDKLPNATVGQIYSVVIGIKSGDERKLTWNITPKDAGFSVRSVKDNNHYYGIEVYGIPSKQELVKIHLMVALSGDDGAKIDKVFEFKINP